jgi:hypothetical protein
MNKSYKCRCDNGWSDWNTVWLQLITSKFELFTVQFPRMILIQMQSDQRASLIDGLMCTGLPGFYAWEHPLINNT